MNKYFIRFVELQIFLLLLMARVSAQVDYKNNVEPIWSGHGCFNCHGGSGGMSIDSYNSLMTSGDHKPLVVAFDTNSVLIKKLKGNAGFGSRMPFGGPYLSDVEMKTLVQWIKEGAKESAVKTSISARQNNIRFSLEQNYPNPFNPMTKFRYEISNASNVSLRIYNFIGKEVALLVNKRVSSGIYEIEWNASGLPSGIYFASFQADGYKEIRKLNLIK